MVLVASEVSGRALRGLDGCRQDRRRSDRTPQGPQCNGGRQLPILLVGEEWRRPRDRQGSENRQLPLREDDRGAPFSGGTHAPSSPREGRPLDRTGRTGPNLHGAHHSGGKRVSPLDLLPSPMSACVREDTNPPDQPGQTSPDAGEPTACCNWATGRAADDMLLMRQLAEPGCSPATALVVAGRSIDCYGDWYVFQPDG